MKQGEDFSWSPLFAGISVEPDPLPTICTPRVAPKCRADALADSMWQLVESRENTLVLRDGGGDRWTEETLWTTAVAPERSYVLLHEGRAYGFVRQLGRRCPTNQSTKGRVRQVA